MTPANPSSVSTAAAASAADTLSIVTSGRSQLAMKFDIPGDAGQAMSKLIPIAWAKFVMSVVGYATQLLTRSADPLPDCTLPLLECYLDHYGPHSDRVWPSEEAVQVWLLDHFPDRFADGKKISFKSLQRALKRLGLIGIAKIGDRAVALDGPGSHQFPKHRRKNKHGVVPIICLGLFLKKMMTAELSADLVDLHTQAHCQAMAGFHLESDSSPSESIETLLKTVSQETLPEPEPPPPLSKVSIDKENPEIADSLPGGEAARLSTTNLSTKTKVYTRTRKSLPAKAEKLSKPAPDPAAVAAAASAEAERAARAEANKRVRSVAAWIAGQVESCYPGEAVKWVQGLGEVDARLMVAYGKWQLGRGEVRTTLFAYLQGTFEGLMAAKAKGVAITWDDDFLRERKREKALKDRYKADQERQTGVAADNAQDYAHAEPYLTHVAQVAQVPSAWRGPIQPTQPSAANSHNGRNARENAREVDGWIDAEESAVSRAATPLVRAPAAPAEMPQTALRTTKEAAPELARAEMAFVGLPKDEREALLRQALDVVLSQYKPSNPMVAIIKKRGIDHREVMRCAIRLLVRESAKHPDELAGDGSPP